MRCLTLYLHPAAEHPVVDALRASPSVSGFTLARCEGHSSRTPDAATAAALDLVVGFVPRVRIEVHLESSDVDGVLDAVRAATGGSSMGYFTVTPVEDSGPL